jgi:pilus assembly protein CpaE
MAETRPVTKKTKAVLVVSEDPRWLQYLVQTLSVVPEITCLPLDMEGFLAGRFDRTGVDALFLDIDLGGSLLDERLFAARQSVSRAPLIVLSAELPHDLARRVVRLGSTDWLQKPIEGRQVVDAVLQLLQIRSTAANKVYAVMSCVGGSGGTSIAIHTAHTLARKAAGGASGVALVDLDFTKGMCAAYLDVLSDVSLDGVVLEPTRVDAEFMDLVRRDYRSQFSVFSFTQPGIAYAPRGEEFVLRMMDVLTYQYRATVVDLPAHYTPWRDRILDVADGIILATEMTIPAIRQAQIVQADLTARRNDGRPVVVVVNRHRQSLFGRGLGRKDAEKSFPGSPVFMVPDDWSVMQDAVDRGIAAADADGGSAFAKKAGAAVSRMLDGGA